MNEVAFIPPNRTAVTPEKPDPVMVTDVAVKPEVGVNDVNVGVF
jgi:hypothetical protein